MRRAPAVIALAVIVLLSPVAAWWIVGDRSETSPGAVDHSFRPLPLTPAQEAAAGWGAIAVWVTALGVVGVALRRQDLGARLVRAAVPLVAAGAFCGAAWRVMTAGVIGANIGAGMVFLVAPVFVPGMVAVSVAIWRRDDD
ncbi:MAG: hypothetical protein ACR2MO_05060 [Acidimicrobiales bacterium]